MANAHDSRIVTRLIELAENGRGGAAVRHLWEHRWAFIDDAAYWQAVAATWIKCGSSLHLQTWRELFSLDRPKRHRLMKKGDRRRWRQLPKRVRVYRAVAPGEPPGIFSYTLDRAVLDRIYGGRREVREHVIDKRAVVAYFTRRAEHEIIVL
jgi:hypothetical protein